MIALIKVGFHHDEEVDEGKEVEESKEMDEDEEVDEDRDKEVQKCRMIGLLKVGFHHDNEVDEGKEMGRISRYSLLSNRSYPKSIEALMIGGTKNRKAQR